MLEDNDEIYIENAIPYSPLHINTNLINDDSFLVKNNEEISSHNSNQQTRPFSDINIDINILQSKKGIVFDSYDDDEVNIENNFNNDEKIKNEVKNETKKRGRKKKIENGREIHDNCSLDNMKNNFKISFFTFIIDFFNCIVKKILLHPNKNSFKYINCKDKNIQSSKGLNKQFKMKMTEILSLDIQKNYKNFKPNHNKLLIKKIEKKLTCIKYKCYENLFNMYLFEFYKEIYLSNDIESLKKNYSLDHKVKLFIDKVHQLNQKKDYIIKYIKMASNFLKFAEIENNDIDLTNIVNSFNLNNTEDSVNSKIENNNTFLNIQSLENDNII